MSHLLLVVLTVEAGVVLVALLWLAAHVALTSRRRLRSAEGLQRARELMRDAVLGDLAGGAAVTAFRRLSRADRLIVLAELTASVGGSGLDRLRYIAAAAGVITQAQHWARSRRWWRRLRGLRLLAQLGVAPTPLGRFFDDPNPVVRAAAADSVLTPAPFEVVTRMVRMLDDPDAGCRYCAQVGLFRAGRDAVTPLRSYLEARDIPAPVAALEVALALGDPVFAESSLRASAAPDAAVRRVAALVLARTGGDIAGERLVQLMHDSDAGVRTAAAEGLGELGHWPAASVLAAALSDSAWTVRRAAAMTLRRIGPPGAIYLRRAAHSGDPFAADIARQVQALPEGAMSVVGR